MSIIATRKSIITNIGGDVWSENLEYCPTYGQIMATGAYNISANYDTNQLVKLSHISLANLGASARVTLPPRTYINFAIEGYDGRYYRVGSMSNTSTASAVTETIVFPESDEYELDVSSIYFWITAIDGSYNAVENSNIYQIDLGSGGGPTILDHYDKTPMMYGTYNDYDDMPTDLLRYVSDGEEIGDNYYEINVIKKSPTAFNYGEGTIQFNNQNGSDLTLTLEHDVDINLPANKITTVQNPYGTGGTSNIYFNFFRGYTDVSYNLYFKYSNNPGHNGATTWGRRFTSQIYSTDLYTATRGPIIITNY